MRERTPLQALTREDLKKIFTQIDVGLSQKNVFLDVTLLGGAAIVLQDFRERATLDIDIVGGAGAAEFQRICSLLGVPVDIITVASTVDLSHAETADAFVGQRLKVRVIMAEDLIRLKLERFRKQDPEDIYSIITKTDLGFERFRDIVREMLIDFIGRPRNLILSAKVVVERMYPDRIQDFILK